MTKMIKRLFCSFFVLSICMLTVSCHYHPKIVPVYFNQNKGIRFGYLNEEVVFVDCVQISDEMSSNSIWIGDYTFSDETLPIKKNGANHLTIGRGPQYATNNWQNENASRIDRQYNTSTRKTHDFAIRACYQNVIPEKIVITLSFPNKDDFDILSSNLIFHRFLWNSFYLWFFPKDGQSIEEIKNDVLAVIGNETSEIPLYFQANMYLWSGYDPINDDNETIKGIKASIFEYWTGSFYCFESYSSSLDAKRMLDFGLCLDEPYPFVD